MKIYTILQLTAFGFLSPLMAQDEPVDPFKKPVIQKPSPKNDSGKKGGKFDPLPPVKKTDPSEIAPEPENVIVLGIEFLETPRLKMEQLQRETSDPEQQRKQIQEWIEKGEASSIDSTILESISGQRAKVESYRDVQYPTKRVEVLAAPRMPLFPKSFESRYVGFTFEADPVLTPDLKLLLNYSLDRSRFFNRLGHPDAVDSGPIQHGDIADPTFEVQSSIAKVKMIEMGQRQLLGTFECLDLAKRKEFVNVAYLRWDLHRAMPCQDWETRQNSQIVSLRYEWIEVPAKTWHDTLYKNELALLAKDSWNTVEKWIQSGTAKSIHTSSLKGISGKRVKAESIKLIRYAREFNLPTVEGGPAEPVKYFNYQVGAITEIDPVTGGRGRLIDLNMAPKLVSQHSEMTYYRTKRGNAWIPTVTLPNIYTMRVTNPIALAENADHLAAVFTPPDKDGNSDYSRKVLLYIHNDTYRDLSPDESSEKK